jgi:hypothetical protein
MYAASLPGRRQVFLAREDLLARRESDGRNLDEISTCFAKKPNYSTDIFTQVKAWGRENLGGPKMNLGRFFLFRLLQKRHFFC